MTTQTHTISIDRTHCRRCGERVPPPKGRDQWEVNERVLVITAPVSGITLGFPVTNDLTPKCQPVGLVKTILALKIPAEVVA